MTLHVEARRWFQRSAGNTYHSVRIYRDGEQMTFVPFAYGYDDMWLQTAFDQLRSTGYPSIPAHAGTRFLRE